MRRNGALTENRNGVGGRGGDSPMGNETLLDAAGLLWTLAGRQPVVSRVGALDKQTKRDARTQIPTGGCALEIRQALHRNQSTAGIQIKQIQIASVEDGWPEQRAALFERRGFLSPVLARDFQKKKTSQIRSRPVPMRGKPWACAHSQARFPLVKLAIFLLPRWIANQPGQPTGLP